MFYAFDYLGMGPGAEQLLPPPTRIMAELKPKRRFPASPGSAGCGRSHDGGPNAVIAIPQMFSRKRD